MNIKMLVFLEVRNLTMLQFFKNVMGCREKVSEEEWWRRDRQRTSNLTANN